MTDIAIRVENLSKRYRIGLKEEMHDTFAGALTDFLTRPIRNLRRLRRLTHFDDAEYMAGDGRDSIPSLDGNPSSGPDDIIWALRDVSFEVKRGEVVGIIGRNGAGKSTLLKILSRITEPTYGRAIVKGRIGALLEVGTGMHPELTGRENIYLNGTILGMKKAEIDRKFDEIVEFAEIGKFIDTPIKRYSSGMKVRLGFAIAAHLEPEILLVDEVLAVGDAAFQKKCLGKMGDVAKEGRTVLFVSHNMGAVNSLTEKCVYLRNGQIVRFGESKQVTQEYLMETIHRRSNDVQSLDFYRRDFNSESPIRISKVWVNEASEISGIPEIPMGKPFTIYVQMDVFKRIHGANLTIILKNLDGQRIVTLFSWDQDFRLFLPLGQHVVAVRVDDLCLVPNQYFADIGVNQSTETTAYDVIVDLPLFRIVNEGQVFHWLQRPWGSVHCNNVTWQIVG